MGLFDASSTHHSKHVLVDAYRRFLVLSVVVSDSEKENNDFIYPHQSLSELWRDDRDLLKVYLMDPNILASKGYLEYQSTNDSFNTKLYKPTPKGLKYYMSNVSIAENSAVALKDLR